jgi:hypothetical protein
MISYAARFRRGRVFCGTLFLVPSTRLARAIAVAAASSTVALAQLHLPDEEFWQDRPMVLYLSVAVLAVAAGLELIQASISIAQLSRIQSFDRDVRAILSGGLHEFVTLTKIDWSRVGVHAFLLHRRGMAKQLVKVGGIRLGSIPFMHRPRWRPGKGVIGIAFQRSSGVAVDWNEVFEHAEGAGRVAWESKDKEARFGLSWEELMLTRQYRGIVARPIYSSGRGRVGCVAIDAPTGADELAKPDVQDIIHNIAAGIDRLGQPPRAWWRYYEE